MTSIPGSVELIVRIQDRIALEPQTPLRRLLASIARLRLRDAAGAFRQILVVASGGRHIRPMLQAQAVAFLLLTASILGALGAGAGMGIGSWLESQHAGPVPPPAYGGWPTATDPSPPATPEDARTTPVEAPTAEGQSHDLASSMPHRSLGSSPAMSAKPVPEDAPGPRGTRRRDTTPRARASDRPRRTETPEVVRDRDEDDEEDEEDRGRGGREGRDEPDRHEDRDEDDADEDDADEDEDEDEDDADADEDD